jgi:hypothetical protein
MHTQQGYTPPNLVLGVSLDGNFATNDAHGSSVSDPNTYGMVWGRGATLYTKIGFGLRKNHRLTLSATYNHMVNDTENKLPFVLHQKKEVLIQNLIFSLVLLVMNMRLMQGVEINNILDLRLLQI